jgi:sugar phosphate isomerase/epimerase
MNALPRRRFFKQAAAALSVSAGSVTGVRASAVARRASQTPVRLGVATYSLREFSRAETIDMIRALGVDTVSVKSFHLPYELSPSEIEEAVDVFHRAGIALESSGNNTISEDTDEHVRMFFDYARAAGIPMLVIAPHPDTLPRVERFVQEYGIRVAIHNHGPEDPYYPAPSDALALIREIDPRVGLCVDVGHTARTGNDVVREIADAGDRVLDMHMKDLRDLSDRESQCIVGEGRLPVPEIFSQLDAMGYGGSVNLEYEIHPDDPLPGMQQSFSYMRGVRDGLQEGR